MGSYASKTSVSPEKSQAEIYATLRKYGAKKFGAMEDEDKAYLVFEFDGLFVRMEVPLPNMDEFKETPGGRRTRTKVQMHKEHDQAVRQRWRALLLAVKAKLEAVESGISTVEKEFMAFVMMPDGQQLGDHMIPKLKEMAATGKMPKMLPGM